MEGLFINKYDKYYLPTHQDIKNDEEAIFFNEHQLENLRFMIDREDNAKTLIINTKVDKKVVVNDNYDGVNDTNKYKFVDKERREYTYCSGSMLADEMGLGKTFSSLALIDFNRFDMKNINKYISFQDLSNNINVFMNGIYSKKAFKYNINISERIDNVIKRSKILLRDHMIMRNGRDFTSCTVIIGPANIIDQWGTEIQKYNKIANINKPLSYIIVKDNESLINLGKINIDDYDILITTSTFFNAKNQNITFIGKNFKSLKSIYWYRSIIDECQQSDTLTPTEAYFKLCITGTPLSITKVKQYLDYNHSNELVGEIETLINNAKSDIRKKRYIENIMTGGSVNMNGTIVINNQVSYEIPFYKTYTIRHTKEDLKNILNENVVKYDIYNYLIPMFSSERIIYHENIERMGFNVKDISSNDREKIEELIRQCCHPLIGTNSDSISVSHLDIREIRNNLLVERRSEINEMINKKESLEAKLNKIIDRYNMRNKKFNVPGVMNEQYFIKNPNNYMMNDDMMNNNVPSNNIFDIMRMRSNTENINRPKRKALAMNIHDNNYKHDNISMMMDMNNSSNSMYVDMSMDEINTINKEDEKKINILYNQIEATGNNIASLERIINNTLAMIEESSKLPCPICTDIIEDPVITKCKHTFCYDCLYEWMKIDIKTIMCPMCRADIGKTMPPRQVKNNPLECVDESLYDIFNIKFQGNAKIGTKNLHIISYIKHQLSINKNAKFIIFSQYDKMLSMISTVLNKEKIKNGICSGSIDNITSVIKDFKHGESVCIILSTMNSAAGTNLTEASHIIFVDPIYSTDIQIVKDIENQAIARTCRMGQKTRVKCIRFIIADTIDQYVFERNKSYNIEMRKKMNTDSKTYQENKNATDSFDEENILIDEQGIKFQ